MNDYELAGYTFTEEFTVELPSFYPSALVRLKHGKLYDILIECEHCYGEKGCYEYDDYGGYYWSQCFECCASGKQKISVDDLLSEDKKCINDVCGRILL